MITRAQERASGQPSRPPKSKKSSTVEPDCSDSLSGSLTPTWSRANSVEKVNEHDDSDKRVASQDEDPFMERALEVAKTLTGMRKRDNPTSDRGDADQVGFIQLGGTG